jgi:DNA-binding response OmpR family regulator
LKRLLIVEDEWIVARFIQNVAISQGLKCIGIASSWEEAEALIEKRSPQLAIIDINIKGSVHGIEVAKRLKKRFADIPLLFLTAYKDVQTVKEAAEASPLAYLIKPVTAEELTANLILAASAASKIENDECAFAYSVCKNGVVYKDKEPIYLPTQERKVLALLLANLNSIVSYGLLYETLWDSPDEINEGSLRNTIVKLRKKLPDLIIETVKEIGYRLIKK